MARGTRRLSATHPRPVGMPMDEFWSPLLLWELTRGSRGLDSLVWAQHMVQAMSPSLPQYFGFVYEGNAAGVSAPGAVTRYTSPKSIPFSEMNGALFRPHNIIIIPQQLCRAISPTETNPSGPGFVRALPRGAGAPLGQGHAAGRGGRFAAPGLPQPFPPGYCLRAWEGRSRAEERLVRSGLSGTKKFLTFK